MIHIAYKVGVPFSFKAFEKIAVRLKIEQMGARPSFIQCG